MTPFDVYLDAKASFNEDRLKKCLGACNTKAHRNNARSAIRTLMGYLERHNPADMFPADNVATKAYHALGELYHVFEMLEDGKGRL